MFPFKTGAFYIFGGLILLSGACDAAEKCDRFLESKEVAEENVARRALQISQVELLTGEVLTQEQAEALDLITEVKRLEVAFRQEIESLALEADRVLKEREYIDNQLADPETPEMIKTVFQKRLEKLFAQEVEIRYIAASLISDYKVKASKFKTRASGL